MYNKIKQVVSCLMIGLSSSVFAAPSTPQLDEASLNAMFKQSNNNNPNIEKYPRTWTGAFENKKIFLNIEILDRERIQGNYQLDGKVTAFKGTLKVTKIANLYKVLLRDQQRKAQLLLWLDFAHPQTLVIDQTLYSPRLQQRQFKLH